MFTNRELAVAIWSAIALAFALSRADIRRSLKAVLKAFFERKILAITGLMTIYVAGIVLALYAFNIWTIALLKETVVWFAFGAVPLAFSSFASRTEEDVFSKMLADSLRVLVLVEFLVTTYTFPLPVELVFVPLITIVMLLHGVARSDESYSSVASLLNGLQALIGIVVFTYAISIAISDYRNLFTIETAREVLLAPIMSVLFAPFTYFMLVLISYESLFNLLKVPSNIEEGVKGYAKRRLFGHLKFNLGRIRSFHRSHGADLIRLQTRADVNNLIETFRT